MICRNCNTEHNGKFCPNCGAPAGNDQMQQNTVYQQEQPRPPKKPITKRWWFWVGALVLLIALLSNLGNDNDAKKDLPATDATQKETTVNNETTKEVTAASEPEPTQEPTPEPTMEPTPVPTIDLSSVATEYILTAGNYVAGVDIPSGKCSVMALSGTGNLSSSNMFSGGINEMFGIDEGDGFYTSEFNGLKLPEGTILKIGGSVKIQLNYSTIESGFAGRVYDEANAIELSSGNYEAGVDFEAGVYKIVAISGTGNLSSDNMFEGGLNEMFGIDDGYGFYIGEFLNVDLPAGTELSLSGGVRIKLIPAILN